MAPLMRVSCSKHIRRASFASDFLFRPRPAHHATHRSIARAAQPAHPRSNPPGVDRAPPRGVTVFAERSDETGAAQPQNRRRHFPPSHRLWGRSSWPHVSPAHAPSRRLQRGCLYRARASLAGKRRAGAPRGSGFPAYTRMDMMAQPLNSRETGDTETMTAQPTPRRKRSRQPALQASSHRHRSIRTTLASKLNQLIAARGLSQAEAGELLGMPQPKISAIHNLKLTGISVERLLEALAALDQHVDILIAPSSRAMPPGIHVEHLSTDKNDLEERVRA